MTENFRALRRGDSPRASHGEGAGGRGVHGGMAGTAVPTGMLRLRCGPTFEVEEDRVRVNVLGMGTVSEVVVSPLRCILIRDTGQRLGQRGFTAATANAWYVA